MICTSLRKWLNELKTNGILKEVDRAIDLKYELAAVGKKSDGKYAVRFNRVNNASMPVVTGIEANRELLAHALGVRKEQVVEHFA